MSKKKIIIPGWSTGENSWGVTKPYLEYFSQFGQVEIITPRKDIVDCDLVVLPGGLDTPPSKYGEIPGFMTSGSDVYKEYFVEQNLPQYIEKGTPIFGICLGFQQLNTFFNGKLVQHIWWDHGYSNPRSELAHQVYEVTGFNKSENIWKVEELAPKHKNAIWVNSLHHQGVDLEGMSEEFIPLLLSPDGFVEAFEHRTLPISGCQFHPEELMNSYANKMIKKIIENI